MSNLGGYQIITTLIKRVGGPDNAMKLAAAAGAFLLVAGGAAHAGVQKAAPALKKKAQHLLEKWRSRTGSVDRLVGSVFTITVATETDQGVSVSVGDKFCVLERDADAVLIELIGNDENPWVVSADLLAVISDFSEEPDFAGPTG